MRKAIISLLFAPMIILSSCDCNKTDCQNKDTMEKEITAINANAEQLTGIKKALNAYIEAALKGNSEIAKAVFTETATISFNENGSLISSPIQALYDYYDQTGPHHAEYEITAAQVAENVAIVSIDSKFGDVSFDDMFTLVKDGDKWKIVSKVYHVK